MKTERINLLKRIDRLENERCERCHRHNYNAIDTQCTCDAAVEIRELGKQLIETTARKRKSMLDEKVKRIKEEGLTVDGYRELREMELSNQQIIKALGVSQAKFYEWKAGALGNQPARNLKSKKHEERRKWRMVAEQNGIKHKTFNKRVESGKSFEEAATTPVSQANGYNSEDAWTASLNGISKSAYRARISSGWPSEAACQAPKSMRLEAWLKQQKVGV